MSDSKLPKLTARLSLTSWSMPLCTLREASGIARALRIGALDVGYYYRSALDRRRVIEDSEAYARETVAIAGAPANLYHLFGSDPMDQNLARAGVAQQNASSFQGALRFCQAAGIPSIMVLPGMLNPGQSRRQALEASSENLLRLEEMARETGVTLTIEPHVHSYLESPDLVLELLRRVPGLRLTLDYSHFLCLGYRQAEIDLLAPHAAHIHLRQGRPGVLQAKLEEGTLNFAAMLGTLREANYSGYLALEYVHQNYMNTVFDDVLSETVKMRDLIEAWDTEARPV